MVRKTEDLEGNLNNSFKNEVVLNKGGKEIIYSGEVGGFYLDGLEFRGNTKIAKYEVIEGIGKKKKILGWFPPKFQTQKVPFKKNRKIWEFKTYDSFFFPHQTIVGFDSLDSEVSYTTYSSDLKDKAERRGLLLSSDLLHLVFSPIKTQISHLKEIYFGR